MEDTRLLDRKNTIDQVFQSKNQGLFSNDLQNISNEKAIQTLVISKCGEPTRNLKGGGGSGACNLHTDAGSCTLPNPPNFIQSSCCKCQCHCLYPLVNTAPPITQCHLKPVESCVPGIHKQYQDLYSDCKESHLPVGYRTIVENDDIYLPYFHPSSSTPDYCSMSLPSRCYTPPAFQSPTQRCHCECTQYQSLQLQPCLPLDEQSPKSKPCYSKPPLKILPSPNLIDSCHSQAPPKLCSIPNPIDTCFPSPKNLTLPIQPHICCSLPSPKIQPLPAPRDFCCFPQSPKLLALPTSAKICCLTPTPKLNTFSNKSNLSFSSLKNKKNPTLLARENSCSFPQISKPLALPARVYGGMSAKCGITRELVDVVENLYAKNDEKINYKSLSSHKQVQQIYVCLPYPSNCPSNHLLSPPKTPPSNDDKNHIVSTICNKPNQNLINPKLPPFPSQCQECIPQKPISNSSNYSKSLYNIEATIPKALQQQLFASAHPYIKNRFKISQISSIKDFKNSSCQYSPREKAKTLQSQKLGPISSMSSSQLDSYPILSPSLLQKQDSLPNLLPKSSTYHLSEYMGIPESPYTKLSSSCLENQSSLTEKSVIVEKNIQGSCRSHEVTSTDVECVYVDQSCSRRPVSPSLYEAISKVLRPINPCLTLQSLLPDTLPHLAPSPTFVKCTCQNPKLSKNNDQFHYATQTGMRCISPPQINSSLKQYQSVEDVNLIQFFNDVKRILKDDLPTKVKLENDKQLLEESLKNDSYLSTRSLMKSELSFHDFPSNIRTNHNQDLPSSQEIIDRLQEYSSTNYLSNDRTTLESNLRSPLSSRRITDPKHDQRNELSVLKNHISSRNRLIDCPQKISPRLKASAEQKLEHKLYMRTIERGTSPIVSKPIMVDSSTSEVGMELCDRPNPTLAFSSTNNEHINSPKMLQSGNLNISDACTGTIEKKSISSSQKNVPIQEPEEKYGYGPIHAISKSLNSKDLSQCNVNKLNTILQRSKVDVKPEEMIIQCCCGMCKDIHSQSNVRNKCAFCAKMHSCCCGMCSCPFQYCPSQSLIPYSKSSTSTTSEENCRVPFYKSNHSKLSQPNLVIPVTRRSYFQGIHEMPSKQGLHPRAQSKCKAKLHIKERHPSPRTLLKAFNNYLRSHSRHSKGGFISHKRCSLRHQKFQYAENPPRAFPKKVFLQEKQSIVHQPRRNKRQQAPWGTHPIVLSNTRPSDSSVFMTQVHQSKLAFNGLQRGCCCPKCTSERL